MSRDEFVFSKRAIVVVATLSTFGAVAVPSYLLGRQTEQAVAEIKAHADVAVARVADSVHDVDVKLDRHIAQDDQRVSDLTRRVDRVEGWVDSSVSRRLDRNVRELPRHPPFTATNKE